MTRTLRLDYPKAELRIYATTPIEESFRANACAKEPWTVDWLERMPAGSVLYDVGANVGSYSLIAAALGHTVVAIEPAFANYARLCENILLNHLEHKIIPLCVALDLLEHVQLLLQHVEPGYSGGGSRLTTLTVTGEWVLEVCENRGPLYVKIDVDGGEFAVLAGFGHAPVTSWLVEVDTRDRSNPLAVSDWMIRGGYDLVARHDTRDGVPIVGMWMGEFRRREEETGETC